MITLGGLVLIKDGLRLDYCFVEAIKSLLPVCDSITVCDGESSDGTLELIREWMTREPKIKFCSYKWPSPKGQIDFYVDWIQYGRAHVKCDRLLHLDADEILSESSYPIIESLNQTEGNFTTWFKRWNLWRDAKSVIPHGVCCSDQVVRYSPQQIWLPSDGPHELGAEAIRMAIKPSPQPQIMHYGFLRKTQAWFAKARELQGYFFGSFDPRLAAVEGDDKWASNIKDVEWTSRLVKFDGEHPALAIPWLKERGYA